MQEAIGMAAIILTIVALVVGISFGMAALPGSRELFYKDQMIMCHQEDNWGLNNQTTTCYKVTELTQ